MSFQINQNSPLAKGLVFATSFGYPNYPLLLSPQRRLISRADVLRICEDYFWAEGNLYKMSHSELFLVCKIKSCSKNGEAVLNGRQTGVAITVDVIEEVPFITKVERLAEILV